MAHVGLQKLRSFTLLKQCICHAKFEPVLHNACFWLGALLQEMLEIPAIELWPTAMHVLMARL